MKEKLGDCYRLINNPAKAEHWYRLAIEGGATNLLDRFYYASAIMNSGRYEEAAPEFRKFLETKPGDSLGLIRLESCLNYNEFMRDSLRFIIHPVNRSLFSAVEKDQCKKAQKSRNTFNTFHRFAINFGLER